LPAPPEIQIQGRLRKIGQLIVISHSQNLSIIDISVNHTQRAFAFYFIHHLADIA
jgi:hypothetical protein